MVVGRSSHELSTGSRSGSESMNLDPSEEIRCACGLPFKSAGAYNYHVEQCDGARDYRADLLAQFRAKRLKTRHNEAAGASAGRTEDPAPAQGGDEPAPSDLPAEPAHPPATLQAQAVVPEDDDARPARRARRLPKRYADMRPVAGAALPPSLFPPPPPRPRSPTPVAQPSDDAAVPGAVTHREEGFVDSPANKFHLFRRFHSACFPSHDPESHVSFQDLEETDSSPYGPYPNNSSYQLAKWQWLYGHTKSQEAFDALLKIVSHPDFSPAEIAATNFKRIGDMLARGDERLQHTLSPSTSAHWIKTPIRIPVPFHKRMHQPGTADYAAGTLHHRSVVDVIRERVTNPEVHPHLHFTPYEQYWKPNNNPEPVRVHGELYTSAAFLEAHREVQAAAPEPGCNLERVVLGLMFASDGTHLADFGDAKMLPVYMALGNESKYRRGQPSNQCFEHIAYFESVRVSHHCTVTVHNSGDTAP